MANIVFTANIIAPVFMIVFVGYLLRRQGVVTENFNALTSRVVFNAAMPAMVFRDLTAFSFSEIFSLRLVLFIAATVTLMFLLVWPLAGLLSKDGRDQGAFIQGAVRGNFAILGFAFIQNAFGEAALGRAALVLAVIMPLYNVYSIIALTATMHREQAATIGATIKSIITNPLILALAAALPFFIFELRLPHFLQRSIEYLAALTLPLALIGIGSSLNLRRIQASRLLTFTAAAIKTVLMPLVCTAAAVLLGFRGEELGILFFFFAAPTAIASYVMAEAMGSNGRLAGDIVLVTTLVSVGTISAGVYLLRCLGYF
ncbi:MAG: AEC family transporter [candidate division KSB1 bacterium]|nr:AEC family transporter [candidate division KSB1 bacterium]MDZ7345800.1 AEC family transporter [candidate division KSB1 bacterium]